MNKKLTVLVFICFAGAILLAGGRKEEGKVVIGVSMAAHTPLLDKIEAAILRQAESMGDVNLIILNADGDADRQITDVETLLVKKVDAVILNPVDSITLGGTVDSVKQTGIPLVEVNTFTDNSNYDAFVGGYEEDAGRIQGRWIRENLGERGNLCIIAGAEGHSGHTGRRIGLAKELFSNHSGWKVLAEGSGKWSRSEARAMTEEWLIRFNDIDVIAAQNDEMALGALMAVREAGLSIPVIGIDAEPEAVESILEGELSLTVFQDAAEQGAEALNVAYGLVKGQTYNKFIELPFREVNFSNAAEFRKLVTVK